jgi:hypothetical protein
MIKIPDSLYYKITNKKCILFIGSGATKASGGLLGSELSKYIRDEIIISDEDFTEDLARYTQRLVDKGYRKDIEEGIRKRLKVLQPSKDFEKIAEIPWRSIYTTNYDDLIEKSYLKQRYYENKLEDYNNPGHFYSENEVPLYKIHGCINDKFDENNPLVITLTDLKLNKKKKERLIHRLTEDLYDTFIFIGYSFADKVIIEILDDFINSPRWESIKEKYVVAPSFTEEDKFEFGIYKLNFIEADADQFFKTVYERFQNDNKAKLIKFKASLPDDSIIKKLKESTLNHINSCFDFYNDKLEYPFDAKYYYRGGEANWSVIKNNLDVNRNLSIVLNNKMEPVQIGSHELFQFVNDRRSVTNSEIILIKGPAASGKSTLLFRMMYDLMNSGTMSFFFKPQSSYRNGLIHDIYNQIKSPLIVGFDSITSDYSELFQMVKEARRDSIPVCFIIVSRHAEWQNTVSEFNRTRLEPICYTIELGDNIDSQESNILLDKLIQYGLIQIDTNPERTALINKFSKSQNLIEIMLEVIDRSSIIDSISSEYDMLTPEGQLAYAITSQTYKYHLMIKWEILKRTIESKYEFSWEDFVSKVLQAECKGTLFEEQIDDWHYLRGRHRYICKVISEIHYKGSISNQIEDLLRIINSINETYYEERFVSNLLNFVSQDEETEFEDDDVLKLLDASINKFRFPENIAFLMHIKGEFLLSKGKYPEAMRCFDTNIQNGENEIYSLHSLGKSYFYLAKTKNTSSGEFRYLCNTAIEKLFKGIHDYPDNTYYYTTLFQVFSFMRSKEVFSEKDNAKYIELCNILKVNFSENIINKYYKEYLN